MFWRSKKVLARPEYAMHRALYKSMGYSDYDLSRPLVGIANSWNRVVPGHANLNQVSEYVKQGIFQAGGTPVEFGVIAACDGIAQGHDGMHYILPTRDLIANDVEMMVQAHSLDAVVLLCSCDKIVPGMLMAAARLDIPAIIVVGGPMEGGCEFDNRAADTTSLTEGLGMLKTGQINEEQYQQLENCATPTCGSCAFLGTANARYPDPRDQTTGLRAPVFFGLVPEVGDYLRETNGAAVSAYLNTLTDSFSGQYLWFLTRLGLQKEIGESSFHGPELAWSVVMEPNLTKRRSWLLRE